MVSLAAKSKAIFSGALWYGPIRRISRWHQDHLPFSNASGEAKLDVTSAKDLEETARAARDQVIISNTTMVNHRPFKLCP